MKKTQKVKSWEKSQEMKEVTRRFNNRNWKAMQFCNANGVIIYPAAQINSTIVRLFIQRGEPFKPVSDILYDQSDPEDVKRYVAAIDERYEMLYMKMKDKV